MAPDTRLPLAVGLLVVILGGVGCAGTRPDAPTDLWEAADAGPSAERRASTRMAARAESERVGGQASAARMLAEGALRLDSRNPYAYLVLARALADLGDRNAALEASTEAEARFRAEQPWNTLWQERAYQLREALEEDAPAVPLPTGPVAPPGRRLDPVLESGQ
jgi:predicted Zn-dependent protease